MEMSKSLDWFHRFKRMQRFSENPTKEIQFDLVKGLEVKSYPKYNVIGIYIQAVDKDRFFQGVLTPKIALELGLTLADLAGEMITSGKKDMEDTYKVEWTNPPPITRKPKIQEMPDDQPGVIVWS